MKCSNCDFYCSGYLSNKCMITGDEYFMPTENCTLVNDDGTTNESEINKLQK